MGLQVLPLLKCDAKDMCIARMVVDNVSVVGGVADGVDDNCVDVSVLMCWMSCSCVDRHYMLLVRIIEPVGILYA